MKIVHRLALAVVLGIVLISVGAGLVRISREQVLFEEEGSRDARVLGRALGHAVVQVWRTRGEEDALAIFQLLPPVSMRVNPPAGFDGQDARASARLGRATLLAA